MKARTRNNFLTAPSTAARPIVPGDVWNLLCGQELHRINPLHTNKRRYARRKTYFPTVYGDEREQALTEPLLEGGVLSVIDQLKKQRSMRG